MVECIPSIHHKENAIETMVDKLKQGTKQIQELQKQIEAEQEKYKKEIDENQRIFNQTMANHRTEI
jgi:hypothetical protein